MWVRMVPGFDNDGLRIPKWREAFLSHGALEGELTIGDEEVEKLHRHTLVARLRANGKDVLPPLVDVMVRYTRDRVLILSGAAEVEPWNRWHMQAWRMEVISLERPPCEPVPTGLQQSTMNESESTQ